MSSSRGFSPPGIKFRSSASEGGFLTVWGSSRGSGVGVKSGSKKPEMGQTVLSRDAEDIREAGCPGQQRRGAGGGGGVTPYQWPDGRRREGARELREGTSVLGAAGAPGGEEGWGGEGQGGRRVGREWRLWTFSLQGEGRRRSLLSICLRSPAFAASQGGREVCLAALAHFGAHWGCSWAWFHVEENKPQAYISQAFR